MSSSKHVQTDIKKLGVDNFTFEILDFCRNRSVAKLMELSLQLHYGIGEDNNSYNQAIGDSKFITPSVVKEAGDQLQNLLPPLSPEG